MDVRWTLKKRLQAFNNLKRPRDTLIRGNRCQDGQYLSFQRAAFRGRPNARKA
jgi:hypothetical protein